MPFETTLLALPVIDLALVGGLAVLCAVLGWQTRRLASRGREAALQRSLFEAKGAIPQLESAARLREQRAETLAVEVKALKERISEQETVTRQKELEIGKRDREIRSLTSELRVLKDGSSNAGEVLMLGDEVAPAASSADPEADKRYAALEARYDALARGLFQRDDRIAELEEQLKNPDSSVPTRTLEQELSELEQTSIALKATLEERDEQLNALQSRLQDEVAQREALEDLAKRRSEGNRELKAATAKLEQQIPALQQEIESRNTQISEREEKLVSINRALREERQQREARETELTDLQGQLTTLTTRERNLEQRLHQRDAAQRALETELASMRDALRDTEATVHEREAAIAEAEQRLAEADERLQAGERTVAALECAVKDREFKIAELEAAANQQNAKLELLRSTFFEAKASHNQHVGELTARLDQQRQALEKTISEQQLALADRELELTELAGVSADLTRARESSEALSSQVAELTDALAHAHAALRQRQCAILWLVARLGSPPLLLPAPVVATVVEEERSGFDRLPQAEVA